MPTPPDFTAGTALAAASLDKIGLWLIETKDVTATATIDFTSVFSTDYRGYRLVWDYLQNTSQADLYLQYRSASGVLATGYVWGYGGSYTSSGSPQFAGFSYQTTTQTTGYIGSGSIAGGRTSGWIDLYNPQNAVGCYGNGQASSLNYGPTLTYVFIAGGILHNTTDTRTGIRLTCNAGTMTGKFSLYGYRN
jgi:hypothetical protein